MGAAPPGRRAADGLSVAQPVGCPSRSRWAVRRHGYDRRVSAKPAVVAAPSPSTPSGVLEVRVSSPDRVLWPAAGMADGEPVTKLDLAAYLVAVAEPLLRALGNRPVTLQRFPEGIEGEEFFSKNPPKGVPEHTR